MVDPSLIFTLASVPAGVSTVIDELFNVTLPTSADENVAIPAVTLAPDGSSVNPAPTTPFVPDNVNDILLSDYSCIYTMVSSLPDGIVIV